MERVERQRNGIAAELAELADRLDMLGAELAMAQSLPELLEKLQVLDLASQELRVLGELVRVTDPVAYPHIVAGIRVEAIQQRIAERLFAA